MTRPMPSVRAMPAANSGPLPPKANSVNRRGSLPRSLDTAVEYQAEIEPMLELADLIAEARLLTLTDHDLELLMLLANGASPAEAAKQLQISERTLRYHREAAVGRLREAVLAAA